MCAAHGGGGLFYTAATVLPNITIDALAVFIENGVRINNTLANTWSDTIRPGTVSVGGLVEQNPAGPGNYGLVAPHAFTNYDINAP